MRLPLILFAASLTSAEAIESTVADSTPTAVATRLFTAISTNDRPFLEAHVDSAGSIAAIMKVGGKASLRRGSLADFLEVEPGAAPFSEEFYDTREVKETDFAAVLGRYRYRTGGRVRHCGEMLVTLRAVEQRWVVEHLQYTVETDCDR